MDAIFRGKRFKICFRMPKNKNHIGTCDYKNKELEISSKVVGKEKLDCIIHEALHACFPDIIDDAINESSTCVADFLWKLKYRESIK